MDEQISQNVKKPWYNFMAGNEWAVFMNIMRIVTFIMIGILIFIMIRNIEEIKIMASDPCQVCASKMDESGLKCYASGIRRVYYNNGSIKDEYTITTNQFLDINLSLNRFKK